MIRSRHVKPSEVIEHYISTIDEANPVINSIVWRNDQQAMETAQQLEQDMAGSDPDGTSRFLGVPIPIKDLTEVKGWPVSYGSNAVASMESSESELVVEKLVEAGFNLFCRTNTPEFGPIPVTENDRYGITRNPWNPEYTPGGSSGGAAATVASGMAPVAHGNDGGGSIRIPASCCGLVGLKVSRGRVPSRYFSWEGGSVEGVLAQDLADAAAVLDRISGPDLLQWYNAPAPARPYVDELKAEPGRQRIGVVKTVPFGLPLDPECAVALEKVAASLSDLNHDVFELELPPADEFIGPFLNMVNSGLASFEEVDWERAAPHIRANKAAAEAVNSLEYVKSVQSLQLWSRRFLAEWRAGLDLVLTPTMSILPPKAGEVLASLRESNDQSSSLLTVLQMAVFTSIFNVTGQPAISLPAHVSEDGLPVGVQLVGAPFAEDNLIRVSAQLESIFEWRNKLPGSRT